MPENNYMQASLFLRQIVVVHIGPDSRFGLVRVIGCCPAPCNGSNVLWGASARTNGSICGEYTYPFHPLRGIWSFLFRIQVSHLHSTNSVALYQPTCYLTERLPVGNESGLFCYHLVLSSSSTNVYRQAQKSSRAPCNNVVSRAASLPGYLSVKYENLEPINYNSCHKRKIQLPLLGGDHFLFTRPY